MVSNKLTITDIVNWHPFNSFEDFELNWHIIFLDACTCKNLIDANGYGNCQGKKSFSPDYGLSEVCYVKQPSGCVDLSDSDTNPGEQTSKDACAMQRLIEGNETY